MAADAVVASASACRTFVVEYLTPVELSTARHVPHWRCCDRTILWFSAPTGTCRGNGDQCMTHASRVACVCLPFTDDLLIRRTKPDNSVLQRFVAPAGSSNCT